jgi:hypothetical protein
MPWPPSPNAAFLMQGITTIKWGTDGLYSTYIVKSMTPTDEIEVIYIENGTGLKSTRIDLAQGRQWDITVIDDTSIVPPRINTNITIVDPLGVMSGGNGTNITARVIGKNGQAARKQEADLIIRAEYLTNIEGAGTTITNQTSTTGS